MKTLIDIDIGPLSLSLSLSFSPIIIKTYVNEQDMGIRDGVQMFEYYDLGEIPSSGHISLR